MKEVEERDSENMRRKMIPIFMRVLMLLSTEQSCTGKNTIQKHSQEQSSS